MVFITGDIHGAPKERFEQQAPEWTENDIVIICGDFGCVWGVDKKGKKSDAAQLDYLEKLPCKILFCDGNHENHKRLQSCRPPEEPGEFPVVDFMGGKAHRIRENIYHLMRGYLYEIEGKTYFVLGGASSHDMEDGILNPKSPHFKSDYAFYKMSGARFRVRDVTWWREELPSEAEYRRAKETLAGCHHTVDYIITHCAPTSLVPQLGDGRFPTDRLTDFLETEVQQKVSYRHWFFGHYHEDREITEKIHLVYQRILPIAEAEKAQ